MRNLTAAGILAVALALGGCSTHSDTIGATNTFSANGNPGGSTPPPQPGAATAYFNPATGQLPYPTDLYFFGSTDGTLNIQPPNALMPNQAAVNALDGFSTTAVIRENFSTPLDPTTFTPATVIIVPVTTDNLTKATTGVLGAPLTMGTDFSAALATDAGVGPLTLEITPLHPLMPSTCISGGQFLGANCTTGTGYLVFLTNGIKDIAGNPAAPDADYGAIKTALATGGAACPGITDATLNGICRLTGAHLAIAAALAQQIPALANSLNPANIVLSFSFTTESTADTLELLYAKTAATAQAVPPTIAVQPAILPTQAGPVQLTTQTFGGIGKANIYVGTLTIPYYLSKAAPLTGSWQAPPFPLDATSTNVTRFNPLPVATQNLQIPILMSVPNTIPGPWPVLIFQHGITRSREDMIGVADAFAQFGFVVAAIDLPLHGVTNAASDPLYASAANPVYTGLGLPATQMSIERTFDLAVDAPPALDSSGSHFINLTSLLTSRDNLREGPADLMTFELALPNLAIPASTGVTASKLAPAPVHYLGHSLGAITGGVFAAVVPDTDVDTFTLASPGGVVSQLLQNSASFAPVINAGLAAKGLQQGTTLYAQFFRDAQMVVDAGDPVNYIAQATALHPIHLLQVVGMTPAPAGCSPAAPLGCPDQVVPNSATQALITASLYAPPGLAAEQLMQIHAPAAPGAVINTNGTPPGFRAFLNFTNGDHGSIIDFTVPAVTTEMQTEAISFTGSPVPPAGLPATTPGTAILIANPTVIQ
jgi:pimeloyl-ACP methyl ester carboxylesterase